MTVFAAKAGPAQMLQLVQGSFLQREANRAQLRLPKTFATEYFQKGVCGACLPPPSLAAPCPFCVISL